MIYEFKCVCSAEFTESRKVADRHLPATCLDCGADVYKQDIPSRLGGCYGAADWNTQHYNLSLGQGVRSNLDATRIAKSRGLSEIGNEDVDKAAKTFENDRKKKLDYDISSITNLGEVRTK